MEKGTGTALGERLLAGQNAAGDNEQESMGEATAASITGYEPFLVPGLLQTEDYARELFRWGRRFPEDRVETLVRARMRRQSLLRRPVPPRCLFFVHENALRSMVGGVHVMHEQVLQLLFTGSWTGCRLRVVPRAAKATVGGPFQLMRYPDRPPVVHVRTRTAGAFLEEPGDVAGYGRLLGRLGELALDPLRSREWLARLASEYDRAEAACIRRP